MPITILPALLILAGSFATRAWSTEAVAEELLLELLVELDRESEPHAVRARLAVARPANRTAVGRRRCDMRRWFLPQVCAGDDQGRSPRGLIRILPLPDAIRVTVA